LYVVKAEAGGVRASAQRHAPVRRGDLTDDRGGPVCACRMGWDGDAGGAVMPPGVLRCCRPTLPAHPVAGCRTAAVTAAPCTTAVTARHGVRQHAGGCDTRGDPPVPAPEADHTRAIRRHADAERVTTRPRTRPVSHSPTPLVRRTATSAGPMRPTPAAPPRSGSDRLVELPTEFDDTSQTSPPALPCRISRS
jgi:hypothetical protein